MKTCNQCNHTGAPAAAQTLNGTGQVCSTCWSEDLRDPMEAVLERVMAEIRRATKVREFVLGGL